MARSKNFIKANIRKAGISKEKINTFKKLREQGFDSTDQPQPYIG